MTDRVVSGSQQPDTLFHEDSSGNLTPVLTGRLQAYAPALLAFVDITASAAGELSVLGGGGGGGGAVTEADGANVALGATTDLATASTVVGLLKAIKAAVQGTLTVATHAVTQSGVWTVARSWTLSSATDSVTADTELPAAVALSDNVANPTAPMVGAAAMLWDSTLNAGAGGFSRVPGSVAAGIKVQSAQLPAALVGGRLSVDASGVAVPVTDNAGSLTVDAPVATPVFVRLSDGAAALVGQKAAAASLPVVLASDDLREAAPVGGFGNPALRVFVNSIRKATYQVVARNISSGALTANTLKQMLSMEHAAASTKNARIRRVWVTGVVSAAGGAVITDITVQFTRGTAASSAGTAVVPTLANAAQAAADTVAKTLPTIVAATVVFSSTLLVTAAAGATIGMLIPRALVYDWSEAGSVEPFILRAGVLESLVVNALSASTPTLQLSIEVELTEE